MRTSVMKLTEQQVNQIKELVEQGYIDSQIAEMFGNVMPGAIQYWRKKYKL